MELMYPSPSGIDRIVPVHPNIDFFAAILGGEDPSNPDVVYYEPELKFYDKDTEASLFKPTTEEKLSVKISQQFIRCAEQMGNHVDIARLFVQFREEAQLKGIVRKAKAILGVDQAFFSSASPYQRNRGKDHDGRMATEFVQQVLRPEAEALLTATECYDLFVKFLDVRGVSRIRKPMSRRLLGQTIKDKYQVNIRNDIRVNGGCKTGWKGIEADRDQISLAV